MVLESSRPDRYDSYGFGLEPSSSVTGGTYWYFVSAMGGSYLYRDGDTVSCVGGSYRSSDCDTGSCDRRRRKSSNARRAMAASAATPTPAPMPALAPVERPEDFAEDVGEVTAGAEEVDEAEELVVDEGEGEEDVGEVCRMVGD